MTKLTQQERVTKAHITIMRSAEFGYLSGVLRVGSVKFSDSIPTAGTNGRDVIYNPDFLATLSDKELTFVVVHEAMHKAYRQLFVWQKLYKENAQLSNMAADYVINGAIVQADRESKVVSMPQCGLLDAKYYNMSVRQVYDLLKQESGGGGGGSSQQPLDEHMWEDAQEMSEAEVKETQLLIDQAIRQGEILRSKMNGNKSRSLMELLEPKIDWREQLRDFITSVCTNKDMSSYRRPSKRFIGMDVYMPSMVGNTIGKIVLAIDTSGSINDQQVAEALTEVKAICDYVNPESLELLYWDHSVEGHETYRVGDYDAMITSTRPKGGGGTRVGSVNEYIKDNYINPEVVVIITDGYVESDWGGEWGYPTLWVITTKNIVSPHGKSIYLGDD